METAIKNLCWGCTQGYLLTFWMRLILQKVGKHGNPTRYHRNRRNNPSPHRKMRSESISKEVEPKLRHGSVGLFKNERTFHFLNSIVWITRLTEITEHWECSHLNIVPSLHHWELRSHKGFLKREGICELITALQVHSSNDVRDRLRQSRWEEKNLDGQYTVLAKKKKKENLN